MVSTTARLRTPTSTYCPDRSGACALVGVGGASEAVQLFSAAIWMRLPHVLSKTAVVTGPMSIGGCVNRTPRPTRRFVLGGDVVDGERCERDAVLDERLLERPRRQMLVRFEPGPEALGPGAPSSFQGVAALPAGRHSRVARHRRRGSAVIVFGLLAADVLSPLPRRRWEESGEAARNQGPPPGRRQGQRPPPRSPPQPTRPPGQSSTERGRWRRQAGEGPTKPRLSNSSPASPPCRHPPLPRCTER